MGVQRKSEARHETIFAKENQKVFRISVCACARD